MTDPNDPNKIAEGRYPEATGSSRLRWWDGTRWTEHTADPQAVQAVQPTQPAPQYSSTAYTGAPMLASSPGTSTNTVFIWLIVLLPLLTVVPFFFVDFAGDFHRQLLDPSSLSSQFALYTDPAYDAALVLGLVLYLLNALLAWRDRVTLLARGIARPFAWPWVFLLYPIYIIGRCVVARRRTGHGLAPIWVWIGVYVLQIVVISVVIGAAMSSLFSEIVQSGGAG